MSRIGVPSNMSNPRTRMRPPAIDSTVSTENPMGLGRMGEQIGKAILCLQGAATSNMGVATSGGMASQARPQKRA